MELSCLKLGILFSRGWAKFLEKEPPTTKISSFKTSWTLFICFSHLTGRTTDSNVDICSLFIIKSLIDVFCFCLHIFGRSLICLNSWSNYWYVLYVCLNCKLQRVQSYIYSFSSGIYNFPSCLYFKHCSQTLKKSYKRSKEFPPFYFIVSII